MAAYEHLYMRHNLDRTPGIIPAYGCTSFSPDIICSGESPLANFQNVLKTPESYASCMVNDTAGGKVNYYYVRCKNGSTRMQDSEVYLYFTPACNINWPSRWSKPEQMIHTDISPTGIIRNLAPGEVGVVQRPFVWPIVPSPATNDHYCLIARLTSGSDPNPVPSVETPLDMGSFLQKNLRFAQRNIVVIAGSGADKMMQLNLSVDTDLKSDTSSYTVTLETVNLSGWDIEMSCSVADSDGKPIYIKRSNIYQDNQGFTSTHRLEEGFHALATVLLYSNGKPVPSPAELQKRVHLKTGYGVSDRELVHARQRNLLDSSYNRLVSGTLTRGSRQVENVVLIGDISMVVK